MPGMCMSRIASANGRPACASRCISASACGPPSTQRTAMRQPCSCCCRMSRLVWLSSTTSTRTDASAPMSAGMPAGAWATGRRSPTRNCDPWPRVLCTPMLPPIMPSRRRQIASPSPVPPNSRVVEPSAWEKCSKILAWAAGARPMPVSSTAIHTMASPLARSCNVTRTTTSPSCVNLTALPTRLAITWRSRNGSPCSASAASGGTNCAASSSPLACAGCANIASTSSTTSTRLKSTASSCRWPDSILEKSRMSLMTPSRCCPDDCTASAHSRCCGCSGLSISNSFMPSTPFIGVRISWLMVARNSLLAALAASANSLACSNSTVRSATCCSSSSRWAARLASRSSICPSIALKPRASASISAMSHGAARKP